MIFGVVYFSSSQDYLDDKLIVTLTDFARAVRVLEYYTNVFLATTIYGINRRYLSVRWTYSQTENLLFAFLCIRYAGGK